MRSISHKEISRSLKDASPRTKLPLSRKGPIQVRALKLNLKLTLVKEKRWVLRNFTMNVTRGRKRREWWWGCLGKHSPSEHNSGNTWLWLSSSLSIFTLFCSSTLTQRASYNPLSSSPSSLFVEGRIRIFTFLHDDTCIVWWGHRGQTRVPSLLEEAQERFTNHNIFRSVASPR